MISREASYENTPGYEEWWAEVERIFKIKFNRLVAEGKLLEPGSIEWYLALMDGFDSPQAIRYREIWQQARNEAKAEAGPKPEIEF